MREDAEEETEYEEYDEDWKQEFGRTQNVMMIMIMSCL